MNEAKMNNFEYQKWLHKSMAESVRDDMINCQTVTFVEETNV